MKRETTCRRCSVTRVNTLCRLYDEGFRDNVSASKQKLKALVDIAATRGYRESARVFLSDLTESYVRKLCWNISSVLTDDDFIVQGISLNGHKRN